MGIICILSCQALKALFSTSINVAHQTAMTANDFFVTKFVRFKMQFSLVCSLFYAFVYHSHLRRLKISLRTSYQFNHIVNAVLSQNTNLFFILHLPVLSVYCSILSEAQLVLQCKSFILRVHIRLGIYAKQLNKRAQINLCHS